MQLETGTDSRTPITGMSLNDLKVKSQLILVFILGIIFHKIS